LVLHCDSWILVGFNGSVHVCRCGGRRLFVVKHWISLRNCEPKVSFLAGGDADSLIEIGRCNVHAFYAAVCPLNSARRPKTPLPN
jgi:hypothetical protein